MEEQLYEAFLRLERSHWWFMARQKILLDLTRRFVAPGGRILDVGCGTGYYLEEARREFDAHGIDFSDTAVRMCQTRGLTTVTKDTLDDLAAADAPRFDAIMFLDVIEHMDDDVATLTAARRLLAPGGITIVTVPAYMFMWSAHDDANQHRRRYVARGLARVLAASGFRVELVTYFNTLLFPLALARRATQRLLPRKDYDELALPPAWLNRWLRRVFELEAGFVRRAGPRGLFPFGLSIAAVGRAGSPA
jgi:SAM-dependent methyltransferase